MLKRTFIFIALLSGAVLLDAKVAAPPEATAPDAPQAPAAPAPPDAPAAPKAPEVPAATSSMASPATASATLASSASSISTAPVAASELFPQAQKFYTQRDYAKALELFKQSAEFGNIEAMYMAGLMLYRGEGLSSPDFAQAASFYQKSANGCFAKAQYNLAILYYQGEGVTRDDVQAYKWLYLAALQGEPRALEMLPVAARNMDATQKALAISEAKSFGRM